MDNEKELQELKRKLESYKMICEDLILENKPLKEKIEEYEHMTYTEQLI